MKLDYKNLTPETLIVGENDSLNVTLSATKTDKILYMLSEGIYKDPIGSIVRELASNMYDAYIGLDYSIMDKPAYVGLYRDKVIFKDFGSGMSPEIVTKVYSTMLESTKEDSDEFIGCFGLGSKTPWAYTSQFILETIVDGVKYEYLINKEQAQSKIIPLTEESTTEHNGTTVIIPFKEKDIGDYYEIRKWKQAIEKNIKYFRGIVFKDYENNTEYRPEILEGDYFLFTNESSNNSTVELVLDQVVYNIVPYDFEINNINFALKFSIKDGLVPNISRESIIINEQSKKIVQERFRQAYAEVLDLYQPPETLKDYYECINDNSVQVDDFKIKIEITKEHLRSKLPDYLKFFNIPLDEPVKFYKVTIKGLKPSYDNITRSLTNLNLLNRTFRYEGDLTTTFKKFFNDHYYNRSIVKRRYNNYSLKELINIIGLQNFPKSEWRTILNKIKEDYDTIYNSFSEIDLKFFEEWKEKNKEIVSKDKKKRDRVSTETIRIGDYSNRKRIKIDIDILSLESVDKRHIYSTDESRPYERINKVVKYPFRIYYIHPNDEKKILDNPLFVKAEEFYGEKNLRKAYTRYYYWNRLPQMYDSKYYTKLQLLALREFDKEMSKDLTFSNGTLRTFFESFKYIVNVSEWSLYEPYVRWYERLKLINVDIHELEKLKIRNLLFIYKNYKKQKNNEKINL